MAKVSIEAYRTINACCSTWHSSKNVQILLPYVFDSNGEGKTGVVIALCILMDQGETTNSVDVVECLKNMRMRRPQMVQDVVSVQEVQTSLIASFADVMYSCWNKTRWCRKLQRLDSFYLDLSDVHDLNLQ